jgi:ABC-type molybdenum transport system ATPase subunit/photorepair protein PhrA
MVRPPISRFRLLRGTRRVCAQPGGSVIRRANADAASWADYNLAVGVESRTYGAWRFARHGVDLDLDATVGSLSTVKQKEVEIMKALALDARVILMDEPTAWLAASEVVKLHATIRALKGVTTRPPVGASRAVTTG